MEEKERKLIPHKGGSGSTTFRVGIPTKWIRDMDLGENERKLMLSYDERNKSIIIKKL